MRKSFWTRWYVICAFVVTVALSGGAIFAAGSMQAHPKKPPKASQAIPAHPDKKQAAIAMERALEKYLFEHYPTGGCRPDLDKGKTSRGFDLRQMYGTWAVGEAPTLFDALSQHSIKVIIEAHHPDK